MMHPAERQIWTVGHSTRTLEEFLEMLGAHGVEVIADVRRYPGSRRYPHFNADALQAELGGIGMGYIHLPELGGRRGKPAADSPNGGWRVASFAAYADYMASDAFAGAVERLEVVAAGRPTAVMCAEAVPWRCHRRLIADALIARGWAVHDIMSPARAPRRELTDFARVENGAITYPPEDTHDGS